MATRSKLLPKTWVSATRPCPWWERGEHALNLDVPFRLADYFGVPACEILPEDAQTSI